MVSKIVNQGSTSKSKVNKGPFESDDDAEVDTVDKMSKKMLKKETKKTSAQSELESANIQEVVDRVTSNITSTLQTLIVSDRVLAAERNSAEWKDLCHLMANNPECINKRMLVNGNPASALKFFGPDFSDLTKVNMIFKVSLLILNDYIYS